MLERLLLQIEGGTYRIGTFAIMVGQARGYPEPVVQFYACYFAGAYLMGSIIILQERFNDSQN